MIELFLSNVRKCVRDANCPFWEELKRKEGRGEKRRENKVAYQIADIVQNQ
jgi:hypothetical protein